MRPYYNDPYTVEFDATVVDSIVKSERIIVSLDQSYFYPTSGGQEHDTGSIAGVEVTDVFEDNGQVFHVVTNEIPAGRVTCRIDWRRRFENMQQHTGQHMLSAAFESLFHIETVSSRLGEYTGTIDLSRQPTENEIESAVHAVNKVVQENRQVIVHFAERENIDAFKLRKPPKVDGTVRIIEVKDFDMSPCGGTHCTHTSEIGVVITGSVEKVRGTSTRIEFYCGNRAVKRFYELQKTVRDSSRLLSASIEDLPAAVSRLKSQLQGKDNVAKVLTERLLEDLCEKILPRITNIALERNFIDVSAEVQSNDELRFVASCVARKITSTFALYRLEKAMCYMNLNLAVKEDAATTILNELRSQCGAKGGGRNGFYSITFEVSHIKEIAAIVSRRLTGE